MTLPQGWIEVSIGEIADTKLGKMLDAAKNKGDLTPYLRNISVRWGSFDLHDLPSMPVTPAEYAKLAVKDGDLFVCEGGEPGRCAVWRGGEQRIVFQKAIHRIRPTAEIDPDYIQKYLCWAAKDRLFAHLFTGTTIQHLPQVGLQQISLPLPPVVEQRRIVAKVDALTARIDRARAELDRAPLLAARLRASVLAEIFSPLNLARWRMARIESLIDEGLIGLVRSKAQQSASGVPYFRMNHYDQDGKINEEKLTFVDCSEAELARYELQPNDVLFNTRNSVELVGKVTIWPPDMPGRIYNNNILRMRFRPEIDPGFAFRYMMSPYFRDIMEEEKSATTSVAAIYQRSLYAAPIPVPSKDEQKSLAVQIDTAFARARRLEAEAARARALIDRLESAILAKAFRGELVPQDPNEEPATVLLDRIRAQRAAAPTPKHGRNAMAAA